MLRSNVKYTKLSTEEDFSSVSVHGVDLSPKSLSSDEVVDRDSIAAKLRDKKLSFESTANNIANECLARLYEDKLNLVSQALESLTEKEKQNLLAEWMKPSAPLAYQLLALYYTPLDIWHVNGYSEQWKILQQKASAENLPKHLLPALEIKALMVENKRAEAIRILKEKKIFHLHLTNQLSEDEYTRRLRNAKLPLGVESYNRSWTEDFSGLDFSGDNLSGVVFNQGILKEINFNKTFLNGTMFWNIVASKLNFSEAFMHHSHLSGKIEDSSFTHAHLHYSHLSGKFDGSNFTNAEFGIITIGNEHSGDCGLSTSFKKCIFANIALGGFSLIWSYHGSAIDFTGVDFETCDLRGAKPEILSRIPSNIIREYVFGIDELEPAAKPFLTYFQNWNDSSYSHKFLSLFRVEPPIKEFYDVLLLLNPITRDSFYKTLTKQYADNPEFLKAAQEFMQAKAKLDNEVAQPAQRL